tara:strand:- start:567 stop:1016 length:450 start_codon:yes stop_codon:yes gene_type:complete
MIRNNNLLVEAKKTSMKNLYVNFLALLILSGCCDCNHKDSKPDHSEDPVKLPANGFLVLLDNPSERSVETSIVISSKFWLVDIKAHGYNQPLIHDSRSPKGKELVEVVGVKKDSALPMLIFLDSQGVVLAASPFPKTINGVKRILNGGI